MSENTPKQGKRKPPKTAWKKGQSGNPGGRPTVPAEVKEALLVACPRAVQRLIEFVEDPDPKIALTACERVIERVLGRVPLPLQGADGEPLAVSVVINLSEKGQANA